MAKDNLLSEEDIETLAERIAKRVSRELGVRGRPGTGGGYECTGDEFHCFNTYHECEDEITHSCANIYNEQ